MTTAPQFRRQAPQRPQRAPRPVHPDDVARRMAASTRPLRRGTELAPQDQTRALRYCPGAEPTTEWLGRHLFVTGQNGQLDRRTPYPVAVLDRAADRY